jgi:ferric-dicitrate binding protein FerR (iron transport regulator)
LGFDNKVVYLKFGTYLSMLKDKISLYKNYSSEDFALDEDFQRWVLAPDQELRQFWSSFVHENPALQAEVEQAVDLVKLSGLTLDQQANEAFLKSWHHIETIAARDQVAKRRRRTIGYGAVAAVVLFAIGLFYFSSGPQVAKQTFQTLSNEIRELRLEDGSVIMLSSNSRLEVMSGKEDKERVVKLTGEAHFQVSHTRDEKKFTVQLPGDASVQVLGTEFNVVARRKTITVYLQSGSVKLHSPKNESILKPGQQGFMSEEKRGFIVSNVSAEQAGILLAWKSNVYIMNDASLADIAQHIEDQFGMPVVIQDPALREKRITAKVPAQDLNVLLKVLSEGLSIRADQKDGKVMMSPQ